MATVKLDYPIEANGKTVGELTLNRLTAGDLAQSESAIAGDDIASRMAGAAGLNLVPASQMIVLIGLSARLPPSAVKSLDASDFDAVAEVVKGFLYRGKRADAGGPAS